MSENVCRFDQGTRMMAAAVLMVSERKLQPSSALCRIAELEEQIQNVLCANHQAMEVPPFNEWLLAAVILYSSKETTMLDPAGEEMLSVVTMAATVYQDILQQFARNLQQRKES